MPAEDTDLQFPFDSPDPLAPPKEFAWLRAERPVARVTLPSGDPAWLVTRHADVRRLLADERFSREATTAPGAPRLLPIAKGSKSIFVMDPPEHTRLRRLVSRAFAPQRIAQLRPGVEEIAERLLAEMTAAGPPADLIGRFARPLPIMVICELLGVPYADTGTFRALTDVMLNFAPDQADAVLTARQRLSEYLSGLIAAKREAPTDDLLMVLINASEDGDRLSEDELLAFGYTLLGAGYHATVAEITHSLLALLAEPGGLRRLRDEPAAIPAAVEELLRHSQAGGGLGALRIALADVELGGVHIKAGDAVLPSVNAANHDELVFTDPENLTLDRLPNPHLAFGHGVHHCLGAQLGRMELQVALGLLAQRVPGLRLASSQDDLDWNLAGAFRTPAELPVTW
jgi:cytochrome P450